MCGMLRKTLLLRCSSTAVNQGDLQDVSSQTLYPKQMRVLSDFKDVLAYVIYSLCIQCNLYHAYNLLSLNLVTSRNWIDL